MALLQQPARYVEGDDILAGLAAAAVQPVDGQGDGVMSAANGRSPWVGSWPILSTMSSQSATQPARVARSFLTPVATYTGTCLIPLKLKGPTRSGWRCFDGFAIRSESTYVH